MCDLPLPISHLNDWKHYRYKVFDTAVQVRNLMWNAEERHEGAMKRRIQKASRCNALATRRAASAARRCCSR